MDSLRSSCVLHPKCSGSQQKLDLLVLTVREKPIARYLSLIHPSLGQRASVHMHMVLSHAPFLFSSMLRTYKMKSRCYRPLLQSPTSQSPISLHILWHYSVAASLLVRIHICLTVHSTEPARAPVPVPALETSTKRGAHVSVNRESRDVLYFVIES